MMFKTALSRTVFYFVLLLFAGISNADEQSIKAEELDEQILILTSELQRRGALGEYLMDKSIEELERTFEHEILPEHPNGPKLTANLVEFYFKRKGVDVSWNPVLTKFPRFVFESTNLMLWMKAVVKYCLMLVGGIALLCTLVIAFFGFADRGRNHTDWMAFMVIISVAFTVFITSWSISSLM